MLFIDKTKWNTLDDSKESKEIAKLLTSIDAKILRVGNDTSDKSEMDHMDKLFNEAKVLAKLEDPETKVETMYCVYTFNGMKMVFLKEEKTEDENNIVVAYYVDGTDSVYKS